MVNSDARHAETNSVSPLKRPLAFPALALALGILASSSCRLSPSLALAFAGTSVILLVTRRRNPHAMTAFIFTSILVLGAVRYSQYTRVDPLDVSRVAAYHYAIAEGIMEADPEIRNNSARSAVGVERIKLGNRWVHVTGTVLLSQYLTPGDRFVLPKYGDRVIFHGEFTSPVEPTNPGGFSYREYLARQRIYSVVKLRGKDDLTVLSAGVFNPAVVLAGKTRNYISTSLERQMPAPESGIAAGMALGTYSTLPEEIFNNFQRTGTLHLLAASGFNCAIILLCILLIFRRMHLPRRWAYAAAIPTLVFYLLVVGTKPSIVRATIMASLLALAYVLRRVSDPLNVLFAAALVILAWRPTDLFDVGFQLSFAAVLAIILVIPALKPWVERISGVNASRPKSVVEKLGRWVGSNITEAICATIAATLGTLPITAQSFNQLSLVSIPVNAAVAMLAPPVLVLSLIVPLVAGIPIVGHAVALADVVIVRAMLLAVNEFGSLSWSCVSIGSPGPFGAAGYYVIVGAGIAHLSRQAHKLH